MERRSLVVENDNSYNTPVKRSNSMSKSQFLTNSVHRGSYVNPEDILTTFFKRDAVCLILSSLKDTELT